MLTQIEFCLKNLEALVRNTSHGPRVIKFADLDPHCNFDKITKELSMKLVKNPK